MTGERKCALKKIVVIGEVLVEIMADTIGDGFKAPQALTGPFPSGAPAIFADQAAKMGQPVALISSVGNDDFGRVNLERLASDSVDTSGIHIDDDLPTGSAFVRYREDGDRDFVFNIKHSASGKLNVYPAAQKLLDGADHLHVMGSSLSSSDFIDLNLRTAKAIKARGGTISFDPNLRKEMLSSAGMAEAMAQIVSLTDLFLPSGSELTLLTEADDDTGAIAELLRRGVQSIVHKNGSAGAQHHDANGTASVKGFWVDEVDPTGAGDCFGATFAVLWLRGMPPEKALVIAAAAGALAVTKRGPMEGTADLATIEQFIEASRKAQ